jgi:regulator of sirC expression with transglutaminase-like and TPR domain
VDKAIELEPERAGAWNMLCWGYAVEGKADLAMEFCEQAVALDPQPNVIDSRGLAHALLGNTEQAIADFEVFIDWLEAQPNRQDTLDERKAWVAALQAGEDPFTPDVLAGLRNQ